jgi:hypothetical protein
VTSTFETAETFQVNLTGPINATLTDGQGIAPITNDDTAPSLSINDVTVIEGNTGHHERGVHGDPDRRDRAAGHRQLRHRERHGHRRQ